MDWKTALIILITAILFFFIGTNVSHGNIEKQVTYLENIMNTFQDKLPNFINENSTLKDAKNYYNWYYPHSKALLIWEVNHLCSMS